jgi:hypothetical protein
MLETAPTSGLPATIAEPVGREIALPAFNEAFDSGRRAPTSR